MELLGPDSNVLLALFMIMSLGLAAIVWLAMLGASLKLSLSITGADEPSYLRCLLVAVLIIFINIAVTLAMFLTFGPQPWYIIASYQVMIQVVLLMLVVRCNPFSAFFASLAHIIFGSIGTVIIAVVLFIFCGSALSGLKKRADELSQKHDDATTSKIDGENLNPFFQ